MLVFPSHGETDVSLMVRRKNDVYIEGREVGQGSWCLFPVVTQEVGETIPNVTSSISNDLQIQTHHWSFHLPRKPIAALGSGSNQGSTAGYFLAPEAQLGCRWLAESHRGRQPCAEQVQCPLATSHLPAPPQLGVPPVPMCACTRSLAVGMCAVCRTCPSSPCSSRRWACSLYSPLVSLIPPLLWALSVSLPGMSSKPPLGTPSSRCFSAVCWTVVILNIPIYDQLEL